MDSWVAGRDSFSGALSVVHRDHGADEKYHIEYKHNSDLILELNKADNNALFGTRARNQTHVGRLDPVITWQLWKDGILHDEKRLRKWLDDNANSGWRTHPMKVSK